MSRNPKNAPAKSKSPLPFVLIGAVLVAVIAAVVLMSRPSASNSTPAPASSPGQTQRQAPQPGAPNPYARGMPTARVTVEEFSDFQCPACGALEPGLRRVIKDYEDRALFVFRN